jgi:D-alanine-D-alanine ligase
MIEPDRIVVLYGGVGAERDVSLRSGHALIEVLSKSFKVEGIELNAAEIPASLDLSQAVVFPALHGRFGEDGTLQAALDLRGASYCGCDSNASRLCMAKEQAKAIARKLGFATPMSLPFSGGTVPLADDIIKELGPSLVIKPENMGSSVGLHFTEHRSQLGVILSQIHKGEWLVERRIRGRELTVGILNGKALGIVEVVSANGVYDYDAKYNSGATEYLSPASLGDSLQSQICREAEALFTACGCRDFARIDFLLESDTPYFLEINTLPGLTSTSLLPKSAATQGYDFDALALELVRGGCERFAQLQEGGNQ